MTPTFNRGATRVLAALGAALLLAVPAGAQQATTTGAVRGLVTGAEGAPVSGATVLATNTETGVRRGVQTDEQGRFQIPFLAPGTYTVRAQMIGYRPFEREGIRIAIGQVERIDFPLQAAPTQLAAQVVTANAAPLIEKTKTGASTRVSEQQIQELPTNGRNFKDLVVLAPGTSDVGSTGAGGGQSIGGGRTAASSILMDGVNNNEVFFGGDARGGDRAPFSYSIEAVKEIQIITAGYDVERGNFTGGTVNAVTKSGTNEYRGSVFGFVRQDRALGVPLTSDDFLGRPPVDFAKRQYGLSLGGPIVKDKAHFFFTFDKQTASDPRPVFADRTPSTEAIRASGMHPDTLARIMGIARTVYGYDMSGEVGQFAQNVDESAFFGRVDWQINPQHTLTLRDNFVQFEQKNDRLAVSPTSTDLRSNAGPYQAKTNSFVASLTSAFANGLTNEFRAQYAYEDKPRPSNPAGGFDGPLPQVTINNIRSTLPDGGTVLTRLNFGADPVLHGNILDQQTLELINNVRYTWNDHTIKVGANFQKVHVFNYFFFNSLGSFSFNSLADFEAQRVARFTRALPYPGKGRPEADYDVYESAVYAQDEWQVSPKLFLTFGLRYDVAAYPVKPDANPELTAAFPYLDVTKQPEDRNNYSPRVGFTFDPLGDGSQVVRGGTGLFYGRSPYVLWSNALLNTGRNQVALDCAGVEAPVPNFTSYAASEGNIPTQCNSGGGAVAGTPVINVFDADYEQTYAWKTNLAYDRLLAENWRVGAEVVYSSFRDNYIAQDDNLNTTPRFTIEGGRPVYVAPARINVGTGAMSSRDSRKVATFSNVFVHRSLGESKSFQGILSLNGRTGWGSLYAAYTFDNTKDNGSRSCCITNELFRDRVSAGNPNDLSDAWAQASFSRKHTLVLSPSFNLPYGVQLSGIVRVYSGLPWTPRYNGDVNGDGEGSNDRLYVPTSAEVAGYQFIGATVADQEAKRAAFEQVLQRDECLRDNRGSMIGRNACQNPWQSLVDLRVAKRFTTVRDQSVEIVADFFNVLNGLNADWGQRKEVSSNDEALLIKRGFDAVTNKFRYDVNTEFGKHTPTSSSFITQQQFQVQLGVKYNF